MKLSVVIPNYNGEKLLKNNIPVVISELEKFKHEWEIIIIDDKSADNSINVLKLLTKEYKNLKYFVNEKNYGFSTTVNRGVGKAKGEILLLLNTDVRPEENFLEPLLKNFEDEKVFAVGCLDKSIEGSNVVLRGRGLGEWKKGFLIHKRAEVDKKSTLWVSGGSGAFRKSIWDKLSGLNELYNPFYWEDIDLSYRAQKSGYKVLFEPKSIVIHEHEKGAIKSKYSEKDVKIISYRNQFIFVWENATDYSLQFLHFAYLPYHILKALINKDTAFFIGFFKALIMFPKILKSSIAHQKLFVIKDSQVINLVK